MPDSVNRRRWARARWGLPFAALAAVACGANKPSGVNGSGGPNNGAAGSATSAGGSGSTIIGTGGSAVVIAQGEDPGRVEIHRLNNTEYDNTVRDLLGTMSQPAATFLAEEGLNFDNTASALGMTSTQYDAYFGAARDLLTEASSTPAELMRFMTCMPGNAAGDACAKQIVETFGAKVYRRPLDPTESARAMKVFDADIARG